MLLGLGDKEDSFVGVGKQPPYAVRKSDPGFRSSSERANPPPSRAELQPTRHLPLVFCQHRQANVFPEFLTKEFEVSCEVFDVLSDRFIIIFRGHYRPLFLHPLAMIE